MMFLFGLQHVSCGKTVAALGKIGSRCYYQVHMQRRFGEIIRKDTEIEYAERPTVFPSINYLTQKPTVYPNYIVSTFPTNYQ